MLRHFIPRNDNRVAAFTLAEVLITLTIIGVIAALTIPNLMQKYTEQTTVKKVQKFYSNLSNAYNLAIRDNGPANEWGLTGAGMESAEKIYKLLFKPYFKIAKDCEFNNKGKCFPNSEIKWFNNNNFLNIGANSNYYKITLDDNASISWYASIGTFTYIVIIYDTNGPKGPNQFGKDYFMFFIRHDIQRPVPYGFPSGNGQISYYDFNTYCQKGSTLDKFAGIGCTAWVIYKGNMDYLHCALTWDKNSCKD